MNNTTTPASVASRLTDEDIECLARITEDDGVLYAEDAGDAAAVLRDYVRMRSDNAQLKARLDAVVKEIEGRDWINDGDLADSILRAARGEGGAE